MLRVPKPFEMQRGISVSTPDLLRELFEQAPDAHMISDEQGAVILANKRAEKLFGYETNELAGANLHTLLPGWSNKVPSAAARLRACGNVCNMKAVRIDDMEFTVEVSFSLLVCNGQRYTAVSIRDTTPNSRARDALWTINKSLEETNSKLLSMSITDPLTDLLNRRGLETVLNREMSYAKRNKTELLVALVDLDDFKSINDKEGHAVGDRVLQVVAQTLKEGLRAVDWLARVGGDEFLILLPCTNLSSGARVAERVRLALSQNPISVPAGDLFVTASLGMISLPEDVCSIEEVLELTRETLKDSKSRGKNRVTFGHGDQAKDYSHEMNNFDLKELLSSSDTCRTLVQPIFRLADEEVVAYEMFTRGPAGSLEMPDDLFRVSCNHNLLTVVDLHCLRLSMNRSKTLPSGSAIHINIFPSTLTEVPSDRLLELMRIEGNGRKHCLEISERKIVADPGYLKQRAQAMRANGIKLAIDDIGYGHSSLGPILMLEPELIKIDGKCVNGVANSQEARAGIEKLVKIAKAIGVKTVAKGIETKDDFHVLRDMGVDFGQGWLWCEPY